MAGNAQNQKVANKKPLQKNFGNQSNANQAADLSNQQRNQDDETPAKDRIRNRKNNNYEMKKRGGLLPANSLDVNKDGYKP